MPRFSKTVSVSGCSWVEHSEVFLARREVLELAEEVKGMPKKKLIRIAKTITVEGCGVEEHSEIDVPVGMILEAADSLRKRDRWNIEESNS